MAKQLTIEIMYWNHQEGMQGKFMGYGETYPFQVGIYNEKRKSYILHPQYIDREFYISDGNRGFRKLNPFWYKSKKEFEYLNPGWSNGMKVILEEESSGLTLTLEKRFTSEVSIYNHIYNAEYITFTGDCKLFIYKPLRKERKHQFYLKRITYINI